MQKVSKIWYVFLVLTLLLLMVGGTRHWLHRTAGGALFPLENGAVWFKRQVVGRVVTAFRAQQALTRLRVLEDEVAQLRLDAAELERIAEENAYLRRTASLPSRSGGRIERCLVLSRGDSSGWWRSLRVNKGSSAGVAPGDAVVTPEGLVGYVTTMTESFADVRLITDPNSRISCMLEGPGVPSSARGILRGCGWGSRGSDVISFLYVAEPMQIDYLPRDRAKPNDVLPDADGSMPEGTAQNVIGSSSSDTAVGFDDSAQKVEFPARTRVVTSGLSGTIPGGIPVGWLVGTDKGPGGLYKTGEVLPAVDFANLTTLFVLTGQGRRDR